MLIRMLHYLDCTHFAYIVKLSEKNTFQRDPPQNYLDADLIQFYSSQLTITHPRVYCLIKMKKLVKCIHCYIFIAI